MRWMFFLLTFLSLFCMQAEAQEPVFQDTAQGILEALLESSGREAGEASALEVTVMERVQGEYLLRTITAGPGQGANLLVEFDSGSAGLRPGSQALLQELAQALSSPQLEGRTVILRGHTDSQGDADMNRRLSFDRAESVRTFLVTQSGLEEDMILVQGFGEDLPVADNNTPQGRQKNRRVEVVLDQEAGTMPSVSPEDPAFDW